MPERAPRTARTGDVSLARPDPVKTSTTHDPGNVLPEAKEVLAVCAHLDDESFGFGSVLAALSEQGVRAAEAPDEDRL